MRKRLGSRVLRLTVVAAGILAGATGVAFATGTIASIVGSDGSINGCYQKVNGQLRVVAEGEQCRPSELPVSWSQEGPQGLQGEQGEQGEKGPAGQDGQSVTSSALPAGNEHCPHGGVELVSASGTEHICNGAPGEQGPPGADGQDGQDGEDGQDGVVGCGLEQRIKAALPSFQLSQECVPPPQEGDVCDDGDADTFDDRIRNGVCAGLPIPDCEAGWIFDPAAGGCVPEGVPTPEICDGIDNDRNGIIDDVPPYPVPNGTVYQECVGGVFGQPHLVCDAGFVNADGNLVNGCETPAQQPQQEVCDGLDNDLNGFVDDVPPLSYPNGTAVCHGANGWSFTCNAGFADGDGDIGNGCETNLMTDPANCGALGNVVSIPNATGACVGGVAVLVSCHPGWHNANGSILDGCELREDSFEPNDSMGAARNVPWGTLFANVAPAGNEDWFRYFADCFVFNPCDVRFQATGGVIIQVFEDGAFFGQGSFVNVGLRQLDHEYRVRVTGVGFVPSYTLQAQS